MKRHMFAGTVTWLGPAIHVQDVFSTEMIIKLIA